MHNCKELLGKVEYLSAAPEEFLLQLICKLVHQVFFPKEYIITAGRYYQSGKSHK